MRQEHVVRVFTAVFSKDRTATAEDTRRICFYKIMTGFGNILEIFTYFARFRVSARSRRYLRTSEMLRCV